ncbi:hypothetical protein BDV95DRAFT_588933 [Massariosphaeria phaeospora]|uniref:Uncharacterized protein n=1 Tax=Massariosphaeria phaeospora TaxID=100035 RepID=A0A7C8IHQ7_9PLEO|nr:hypothetical protein BDV95DRAFT_588933 [Massariosphaeria phaeospora]
MSLHQFTHSFPLLTTASAGHQAWPGPGKREPDPTPVTRRHFSNSAFVLTNSHMRCRRSALAAPRNPVDPPQPVAPPHHLSNSLPPTSARGTAPALAISTLNTFPHHSIEKTKISRCWNWTRQRHVGRPSARPSVGEEGIQSNPIQAVSTMSPNRKLPGMSTGCAFLASNVVATCDYPGTGMDR